MEAYSRKAADVVQELQSDAQTGLTEETAAARLGEYGPNKLAEKKKKSLLARFIEQFKDVMILILLVAAVISFVVACVEGDPMEFIEPALIVLIVVLNAVMGLVQESKAEKRWTR